MTSTQPKKCWPWRHDWTAWQIDNADLAVSDVVAGEIKSAPVQSLKYRECKKCQHTQIKLVSDPVW